MATDREIALEQAIVALLAAAQQKAVDLNELIEQANELMIDNSKYRYVDHPHVSNTMLEISMAFAKLKATA